ncbi:MAG: hypothetical protein ACMUIM_04880 [bacterium]
MTGAHLASQLILIRPTILVILTSGYSEVITPEKAREISICQYIMKPSLSEILPKPFEESWIRKKMKRDKIDFF